MVEKFFKSVFMLIFFCLLPAWGFLPIIIAAALSESVGLFPGVLVGVIFGFWFYGSGIVVLPLKIDLFKDSF